MTLYSDLLLPLVVFAFPFTSDSPSFNQRMGMGQQLHLPRKPGRAGEGVTEAPSKSRHRSRQPKDRTPPGQTHLSILFLLSLQIKPFYASEGVEKREPSYTVGGNVNWCSHYWRQYGISSKNQKKNYHRIQQFCPGYVSRKNGNINSKRYTPVIIAILFTIRKTRMQPKCPLWMDKGDVVYIYQWNISHKKNQNNAICSNMDRPRDYHTKWSKSERDKYHMISLIHGI